ncbi:Putative esterase superfamily protein [Indibacter alkaliphilus LW1]|uniref:Esterase superfamily protein n=1 Tax=Indibacter alkaliphilus (strain CCUG 57479 / KCTC 22604 / LW1) TaxID=1189612 RepID=S2D711_INDAL|nr:alpha/beta hydrolase-fold protein [Indibacter alkaliphilus]EOZ92855.1 Putative esterase superfamily protein [Indibacter alkaliphilus LW1]
MKKFFLSSLLICLAYYSVFAQKGTKERIQIHSTALEGNLIGDPAERDVTVYLPPSYNSNPESRYPVLYMLHGFTDTDAQWFGWEDHWINLQTVIEESLAEGLSKEMIVVMPNAYNRFKGSMYASSVTIGDWETFVTKELVSHIDDNYRTIAKKESRGLAGHSMGGYGTLRLGMKYPDVFSSIYAMSPCCMDGGASTEEALMAKLENFTVEDLDGANFFEIATLATSAAFAPNPQNPPFYLDLPAKNGEARQEVINKIIANRTLNFVDQYVFHLKRLKAIAIDAGLQDRGISEATKTLHGILEAYEIPHVYESYEGDHLNRIAERIQTKALPFFTKNLVFQSTLSEIIEDGGTGDFTAIMVTEASLPTHTVFKPQDMGKFGQKNKLPIIAWGNGACFDSPFEHVNFLNEVASHGFLVVAIGNMPKQTDVRSQSHKLLDAIDWAIAQNSDPKSPYYQKLDTEKIAVSGMSCGGLQTLEVADDPRISTVGVFNSGVLPNPGAGMPGMPQVSKEQLGNIKVPTLYLLGGESDIAYRNGMDDFDRINHVPVFVGNLDVGHGGTYAQPHGGDYARVATHWYKWQLKGDEKAGKLFTGKTPGLSKYEGWKWDKKNMDCISK